VSRKIIIYDDFYKDPDYIRFLAKENISLPLVCSDFNELAASITGAIINSISTNHGCFQLNNKSPEVEKITFNTENKWTCLLFLTENCSNKQSNGVTFWKNKNSEYAGSKSVEDTVNASDIINGYVNKTQKTQIEIDKKQWNKDVFIPGKYNRAVFFRSELFHSISKGFGKNFENGQLIQTFAFGDNNESN